ncbi:hypothetical protein CDAR_218881 [Caerostris darwini]|uniref:Uncharacterized protein n=1 Tax=Caerostris darwini TaxID=1538125 RepID=A0AAV4VR03_9ARAC|nr:hypothetical protein CDAR_218881 [Caerostris darwini]
MGCLEADIPKPTTTPTFLRVAIGTHSGRPSPLFRRRVSPIVPSPVDYRAGRKRIAGYWQGGEMFIVLRGKGLTDDGRPVLSIE